MNKDIKVIGVASIGGVFEFYDFVIFVLFAKIISKAFFDAGESAFLALLSVYVIFAVGYFVRPVGGIILAHFGDRYGRKKVFTFTVFLMALSTFLIGFLPTYSQIGIAAPVLLLIFRILQGLAVGGEIPGSATFVYEHMADNLKCTGIAVLFAGLIGGILLGSVIGTVVTGSLSAHAVNIWGWRIPFLFGGVLGIVGVYLRKKLTETPAFVELLQHNKQRKIPFLEVLKNYKKITFAGFGITMTVAVTVTTFYMYLPVYLEKYYSYPSDVAFGYNCIGLILYIIVIILWGRLKDKSNYKVSNLFITGAVATFIMSIWGFYIMRTGNSFYMIFMYLILSIGIGGITATFCYMLTKIYPAEIRFSGVSTSYNIAFAVFGGLTPIINTLLCKNFNSPLAPIYFLVLSCIIGIISAVYIRKLT
ncbi:MAG TPA: MFS transporter [Victivallales bacterium]|nr:MFS transporter [Victivallales bacterium]